MVSCFVLTFGLVLVSTHNVLSQVNSTAQQLELYEDVDYKGLLWSGPTKASTSCYDLFTFSQQKARSLVTNICVVAFSREHCSESFDYPSFVFTPGNYPDLSNVTHPNFQNAAWAITSFRECGEYDGDGTTYIQLFGYSNGAYYGGLLEYYGITGCFNLPYPALDSVSKVVSKNCFRFFDSTDCNGTSITLLGGTSKASEELSNIDFSQKIKSIAPCSAGI